MTTHPSIPAAPAADSEFTARMAEIRDRIEQATPGPWVALQSSSPHNRYGAWGVEQDTAVYGDDARAVAYANQTGQLSEGNAALIAHAPTDLAYLLDGLLLAQAQRDAARASLAEERRVTALQARQYQAAREEAQAAHREALAARLELGRAEAEAGRLREAVDKGPTP